LPIVELKVTLNTKLRSYFSELHVYLNNARNKNRRSFMLGLVGIQQVLHARDVK
jgi:hypothetical protein